MENVVSFYNKNFLYFSNKKFEIYYKNFVKNIFLLISKYELLQLYICCLAKKI